MGEYPKTTKIVDLRIYPIKSCRGISVKSSTLTQKGLKYDRCCMFVDAARKFITIRQKPEMTLIQTWISEDDSGNDCLTVTFPAVTKPGTEFEEKLVDYDRATTITVPLEPDEEYLSKNAELVDAEIWGIQTDAYAFTLPAIEDAVEKYFKAFDPESKVRFVIKGPTLRQSGGNASPELLGR